VKHSAGWADERGGLSLELAEMLGPVGIWGGKMLCKNDLHTGGALTGRKGGDGGDGGDGTD